MPLIGKEEKHLRGMWRHKEELKGKEFREVRETGEGMPSQNLPPLDPPAWEGRPRLACS